MNIQIKLKKTSKRDYLITQSGYTITKTKFIEVDDSDKEIESIILYRNDIIIKDIKNLPKSQLLDKGKDSERIEFEFSEEDSLEDVKPKNTQKKKK